MPRRYVRPRLKVRPPQPAELSRPTHGAERVRRIDSCRVSPPCARGPMYRLFSAQLLKGLSVGGPRTFTASRTGSALGPRNPCHAQLRPSLPARDAVSSRCAAGRVRSLSLIHVCIIALALLNSPAKTTAGEIYKSVDSQGKVTYSDRPSPHSERIYIRTDSEDLRG